MQIKRKTKLIRIIGYSLLFFIFLQIILGAWIRLTGSGMSCPDWPLCYGYIFPTPSKISSLGNIEYTYLCRGYGLFIPYVILNLIFIYLHHFPRFQKTLRR